MSYALKIPPDENEEKKQDLPPKFVLHETIDDFDYPSAHLGKRFVAHLLDTLFFGIFSNVIAFVIGFTISFTVTLVMTSQGQDPQKVDELIDPLLNMLALVSASITYIFCFVLPIYKTGKTLGKKIMGIKIVQINGDKLPATSIFFRESLGKFLSAIFIGMGYIWAFFNEDKRALHDYMSKTKVVNVK